jgi:hypothetical protein
MSDKISLMFTIGDSLHIARGNDMWSLTANGKEPSEWEKLHFADVGTSEEFVEIFAGEFMELVDATNIHGDERKDLKESLSTILTDGLMPAFDDLRMIRSSIGKRVPEMNRRLRYEELAGKLWFTYKDLMPKAAAQIGFDLGFLFQSEATFERGLLAFQAKHPNLILNVPELLKKQRGSWHQDLYRFRNNFIQHRSEQRKKFDSFYRTEWAEAVFDSVWRTMGELFPAFLESRFPSMSSIRRIPESERQATDGRRFQFFLCEPVEGSLDQT